MAVFFMDTSAIIKRYVAEIGTAWITAQALPIAGNVIIISRLTTVELCSALSRLQRLNQLSAADCLRLRSDFLIHVDKEYLTVPLDEPVLIRARDLVSRYPLRALDAIQLACALEAVFQLGGTMTFVCADNDLLNAANSEGFKVENPLL